MDFAHWDPRRPLRCHRLLELDWYDGWVGALGLFGRELEAPEWLLLERVGKCYAAEGGIPTLYLCTPVRSDFEALLPAADSEREHFVEWEWCTEEALEVLRAGVAEYACAYVILDTRPRVPEVAQHFELNGGEARSGSWARLFREDLTPPAPLSREGEGGGE